MVKVIFDDNTGAERILYVPEYSQIDEVIGLINDLESFVTATVTLKGGFNNETENEKI